MGSLARREIPRAVPVAIASLLLAGACGGAAGEGATSGAAAASRPGSAATKLAPDFALKDLDGKLIHLADSKGKVRLVDFWATWCAPCREEIPEFKDLHARYADKGLEIIAISMDENAGIVKPFVQKNAIPYTNLMGDEQVVEAFGGIVGYPAAFLIDREGRIVASFVGPVPKKVFEQKIREMLGQSPAL